MKQNPRYVELSRTEFDDLYTHCFPTQINLFDTGILHGIEVPFVVFRKGCNKIEEDLHPLHLIRAWCP
jgi:hypothetical protein